MRTLFLMMLGVGLAVGSVNAEDEVSPAQLAGIARAVSDSLVQVEYTLKYDKGEKPTGSAWSTQCPGCGKFHHSGFEKFVKEERPFKKAGFLVGDDLVLTSDVATHPRFIDKLIVRYGDGSTSGTIERHFLTQNGVLIKLAKPLGGAKPLAFNASGEGPYCVVNYSWLEAEWKVTVNALPPAPVTVRSDKDKFRAVPAGRLITDMLGAAVGVSMNAQIPLDDTWKGTPLDWPGLDADGYRQKLSELEDAAQATLLRVQLSFRSPKKKAGDRYGGRGMYRSSIDGEDANATEKNVRGVVIKDKLVLVLKKLKAGETARLERITLHLPDGKSVSAKFGRSLTDFGALTVVPETSLANLVVPSDKSIHDLRNRLLLGVEIRVKGDQRIDYYIHRRIASCEVGRRSNVYPKIPGETKHLFLFGLQGDLVALPVENRYKGVTDENRWRYNRGKGVLTPYSILARVLKDIDNNSDTSNVPLSEEEENRLAWMGVELQALTRELARTNNVSKYSNDGEFGALVSYVYPESPAAIAGIETGAILVRIHVEGEPQPLNVKLKKESAWGGRAFPWAQLDQMPENYFDKMPMPWNDVESSFVRTLTDFGFDRKYKAEFFIDGKIVLKDMVIEQSPPYYGMALKYKSEGFGVTVRNITYEARRYFQMTKENPGVIISKIEPGSKASVSGIKPYEIITHINDKPVSNVKDFEKLVAGATELQLNIKRMTQSRIVKVKLDAKK